MTKYLMGVCPLILGFILDLIIGDPYNMPHPIRAIGIFIEKLEAPARKLFPKNNHGEMAAGGFLVLVVLTFSFLVPAAILIACFSLNTYLGMAVETVMCYQILAVKSLKKESMKVYHKLDEGNLPGARYALSMIVGRDTENLSEEGVIKAAVETVAENSSDGMLAPMIYMAIGGPALGFLYKAVNTMDSMIGYKNDKYLYFGRIAAKLDDVFNYIPARVAGLFMILGAWICGFDAKGAWRIFKRDRYNHASPNSAQTEAACAGALNIQLAGDAYYFGKLYKKKTIGDKIRPVEKEDIVRANILLYTTAVVTLTFCVAGMEIVKWLI